MALSKLSSEFKYSPKNGKDRLLWATNILSYHDDRPFQADEWQQVYFESEDRFIIANKSRRIGWSYITAARGLVEALDPAISGYTKQFVSYSLEDAVEKVRVAAEFYDSIPELMRPKKLVSRTRTHLEFMDLNGRSISRLISLPCRAPRGKGGNISLDEFAFHQKDNEIYTAALPIISRGGNLEIGSTPFGNKGKFFEIVTDKHRYGKYRRYSIPWHMSPALCTNTWEAMQAFDLTTEQKVKIFGTEILKDIILSMPIEDFQQEYECLYRDELAAFITLDMIQACTPVGDDEIVAYKKLDDFLLVYNPAIHGSLYAGYDVGRTNDKSELMILGYYPEQNVKTLWCMESMKGVRFEDQERLLMKMMKSLPIHRLAMDATGIGMDLAERMTTKFNRKVEGCMFTNEFKEVIANAMWLAFDAKSIILPADRDLQAQIHSIKKTVTAGKHARFDCDRNERGHGDKWWALALAEYAIESAPSKTRGQFYQQWEQKKKDGTVRVSNPKVVLSRIASNYQKKI